MVNTVSDVLTTAVLSVPLFADFSAMITLSHSVVSVAVVNPSMIVLASATA